MLVSNPPEYARTTFFGFGAPPTAAEHMTPLEDRQPRRAAFGTLIPLRASSLASVEQAPVLLLALEANAVALAPGREIETDDWRKVFIVLRRSFCLPTLAEGINQVSSPPCHTNAPAPSSSSYPHLPSDIVSRYCENSHKTHENASGVGERVSHFNQSPRDAAMGVRGLAAKVPRQRLLRRGVHSRSRHWSDVWAWPHSRKARGYCEKTTKGVWMMLYCICVSSQIFCLLTRKVLREARALDLQVQHHAHEALSVGVLGLDLQLIQALCEKGFALA